MWKLGRLLHLLEHWHLLLCQNEHVYHSISLVALVDLHRLPILLGVASQLGHQRS